MKLRILVAGLLCALTVVALAPAASGVESPTSDDAAQDLISTLAEPGPNDVLTESGAQHTIYRPADLGAPGTRHPVIVWGNGTGAVPLAYDGLLRHLASYGFIVSAANTTQANDGAAMLAGARELVAADGDPASPYADRVDTNAIGAAGHSQGGAGAMNAGADRIVRTTVAVQPGPAAVPERLRGPVLYLAGDNDVVVSPALIVKPFYQRTRQVEAAYAGLRGAGHLEPVPDGGGFRGLITAWFLSQLDGDRAAAGVFDGDGCAACVDTRLDYRHHT
ncbi:acetylxylan esterase [Pseudonocardia endophytica]|uniref:Chlorophyllase-like protein n=1 Tax=Pseudonocardia endophytica TaxID=401976 RepID=A0A4R1HXQ3_PSEEN|nr:acetylxylan esterase [Pseudonocardia endophytica]TCK26293.1 chlorophyllase-like protein [Pseudonocardia endophytica]